MLLHDNTSAHSAIGMSQFLAQHRVAVLDHPPYSLNLASADFFLFLRLKEVIKGARFADLSAIKDNVTDVLRSIPKEAFADSFQKLYERYQKYVVADDGYFEGQ
mgnify:CR=1 FL=1